MRRLRARYGAGPAHLVGYPLGLAVIGLAAARWFDSDASDTRRILVWFGAAIVAHDLVLLPLYSLADRLVPRGAACRYARLVVHIRVPAILSGLLLLVFFPLILRHRTGDYRAASTLTPDAYLSRWLLASAALFACSALIYTARVAIARRRRLKLRDQA